MDDMDREDKKTRVEHAMMEAVTAYENGARPETEDINMEGGAPDPSGFPFSATMSQDGSRLSSLSGEEEGSNSDVESMIDEEGGETHTHGAHDGSGGGGVPLKKETSGRIKRQVSHDESMTNSNSSSQNRQSSVTGGGWGWYEDVHGHEHSAASGGDFLGGGEKGDGKKDLKKSGIWKMGSDLMQSALEAIIEPQKQGECTYRRACFITWSSFCFVDTLRFI